MDLVARLEELSTLIRKPESGKEAFDLWNETKSELTTQQRVDILAAWNLHLRTGKELPLVNTIQSVKREIGD